MFSFRDDFGQWDPKNQRPELWNLFNGRVHPGEQIRVFPLSNWTELDVWRYIGEQEIELPPVYFAAPARSSSATACCTRSTGSSPLATARRSSPRPSATAPSATPT
ncbi:hypothetical protein GCM10029992_29230 [Glycomyces albus]